METRKEKKLVRIENYETKAGGVSLGLSEYFDIDITIIRVLFVMLFFTPFPSVLTYVVLWIILPVKSNYNSTFEHEIKPSYIQSNFSSNDTTMSNRNNQNGLVGGAILIILGIIFSFKTFFDINLFHLIGKMWPIFLIGLGVWLIMREKPLKSNDDYKNDYLDKNSNDLLQ